MIDRKRVREKERERERVELNGQWIDWLVMDLDEYIDERVHGYITNNKIINLIEFFIYFLLY